MNKAIVIPTIRPKSYKKFIKAWSHIIKDCELITVFDGEKPVLKVWEDKEYSIKDIMGKDSDLISNFISAVRMLGFAYIAKHRPEIEYIMTVDDDTEPIGNPLLDHLSALQTRVSISWVSIGTEYTRGFPYNVRSEAEVVLSHGVWEGIHDYDAPTQLIRGNPEMEFYKMAIPKGIFYPMSIMNVCFKRKLLPYFYLAPRSHGLNRADDVFGGQDIKKEIDKKGWAVVTGYSRILHRKASNVFTNLEKEAKLIRLNETYWQGDKKDPYFKVYYEKKKRWRELMKKWL